MPLTGSLPITLQAIQSEFGAANLAAASTAALLDPLPTDMDDFLGLGTCTVNVTNQSIQADAGGGLNDANAQADINVAADGVLYWAKTENTDQGNFYDSGSYSGQWRTGQCSGSSDFYIYVTVTSETHSGDYWIHTKPTPNTWIQITGDQQFSAYCSSSAQSGSGVDSATADGKYSVQFKKGSGGSTLATVTFEVIALADVLGY